MSNPLRLAIVASLDTKGVSAGSAEMRRELAATAQTAAQTAASTRQLAAANDEAAQAAVRAMQAARGRSAAETELRTAIDQLTGVQPVGGQEPRSNRQARDDIAAYGAALDDLRARHNPLFAAQRTYEQNLASIDQALKVGAISQAEHAAAVTRAEAAYRLQQAAIAANDVSVIRAGQSTKLTANEVQNLSFQLNDIAMMLMSGQSFGIIMAQQGMQVAQIFGPRGLGTIIPAVGAGIMSLINPTTLALAGITALGYGASYVFDAMSGDIAEADGALKDHLDLIDSVARRWAGALPGLQAYNDELRKTKDIEEAIKALRIAAREQYEPAARQLPDLQIDMADVLSQLGLAGVDVGKIAELQREFSELQARIADGTATGQDAIDVQRVLGEIADANLPKMREYADVFREYAAAVEKSNEAAAKHRILADGNTLIREDPATGEQRTSILSPLNPLDGYNRTPFQTEDEIIAERARRLREEEENRRLGALVPTPTPRPNLEDILPSGRDAIQAQQDQIEILRIEAATVGDLEYKRERLVAALKTEQDIRRLGIDMWGEEAERMRANTAALSDLIEMRQRAELRADLRFDREQMWRSPEEQEIAQRLRGTGLGLDSADADRMRRDQRLQDGIDIGDDLISGITGVVRSGSGDIGRELLRSVLDTLRNVGADMLEDGLRSLWRSLLKSATSAGGDGDDSLVTAAIGSAAKLLTGGGDPWAGKRDASGGGGSALAGSVGALTSAASAGRSTGGSVAEQAWNFFASKGLADHQVAGILGNIQAESAFNPKAIGDAGNAFGLFQHNDRRWKLFQHIGGMEKLGDVQGQLDFAWKELQGPERRAFDALLGSRNVREATAAFAGFERPSGFSWSRPEGAHNFAGRLSGAEDALQRFGGSIDRVTTGATEVTSGLGDVSKGLGTAAGEVGQFGKSLANFFPAAPSGGGGGGIGGWLGKLFGGGGASLDWMNSISPAATQVILGGGMTGLFADGAAFLSGAVIPFAAGDVFDKPTLFPMPQGRTGMMGEAGPEAIMPLARGRDGELGVSVFGPGLMGMAETLIMPLARGRDGKLGVSGGEAGPMQPARVMPFAAGGVFDEGSPFPMPMGRIGGMPGEAATEAPLARGRDGSSDMASAAERAPVPMMAGRGAAGAGAAGQAQRGEMVVRLMMPAGWRHEIVSEAREGAAQDTVRIVADYDDGMPDRVAEITNGSRWAR